MAATEIVPALIEQEPSGKEFRKANSAIAPRVERGGTLTLLARKLFNVLLYHTQTLGVPGKDAPANMANADVFYWLPLKEVLGDVAYGSRDYQLLIDTLLKLQDIKIISDDPTGAFASDVMLGSVRIVPGSGRRPSLLGWHFPVTVESFLRDPKFYTRLSIYHLTCLQTTGGAALYEIAKRYASNHDGLTRREPWTWWYDVLTGLPTGEEKPEYRYFKRDVLKRAIADVNTTDIRVELREFKDGRWIKDIQFVVTAAPQAILELPPAPVFDGGLLQRIETLGISTREAEDILASHHESYLRATLALVEERVNNATLPPVRSHAALLRTALRDRYAEANKNTRKPRVLAEPKKAKTEEPPVDAELQNKLMSALAGFDALDEKEQVKVVSTFRQEHPGLQRLKTTGRAFRLSLSNWLICKNVQIDTLVP